MNTFTISMLICVIHAIQLGTVGIYLSHSFFRTILMRFFLLLMDQLNVRTALLLREKKEQEQY